MAEPSAIDIQQRLRNSFALDRLWRETMGLPPGDTKEEPLRLVISVLEASGTRYAVISGIAVQLHTREPLTTLDIDLAVTKFDDIPADALAQSGFEHDGRHEHSDNWRAPGSGPRSERTAIQFSAEDIGIADAVAKAREVDIGGLRLHLATLIILPRCTIRMRIVAALFVLFVCTPARRAFVDVTAQVCRTASWRSKVFSPYNRRRCPPGRSRCYIAKPFAV